MLHVRNTRSSCLFLFELSSVVWLIKSSDIARDIEALHRDMQRSIKHKDAEIHEKERNPNYYLEAHAKSIEAEKERLKHVVPATASGRSCQSILPLQVVGRKGKTPDKSIHPPGDWILQLLDRIWDDHNLSGHVKLTDEELAALNMNASIRGCMPSTFGDSIRRYEEDFFAHLSFGLGSEDVYIDLGGGVGRATMYAFLKYNLSRAVSIELSTTRFARSCQALQRLQDLIHSDEDACGAACLARMAGGGYLEMVHDNILAADLSQATAVTMWASCFPVEVVAELQRKLLQELREGVRIYATLGPKWDEDLVINGKVMRQRDRNLYVVEDRRQPSDSSEL